MTTIHCTREDCRRNDGGQCKKADIVVTETGCGCYEDAPPERDREKEGLRNDT